MDANAYKARQNPAWQLQEAKARLSEVVRRAIDKGPQHVSERGALFWAHAFELACAQADIDHRLTKPKHPLGQGPGRTNEPEHQGSDRQALSLRTHDQLRSHLGDFINAYNSRAG